MKTNDNYIEEVTAKVLTSGKYSTLYPPTVRRVTERLFDRYPPKQLEKEVRKKLHQAYGAYIGGIDGKRLEKKIEKIIHEIPNPTTDEATRTEWEKEICLKILNLHTSTNERTVAYDELYQKIFEVTGVPTSITDAGCALNPFSFPFFTEAGMLGQYIGFDLDKGMIEAIEHSLRTLNAPEGIVVKQGDILSDPSGESDLLLMFKLYTLLDRQDEASGLKILQEWKYKNAVISFPIKTISGRDVGMEENYTVKFENDLVGSDLRIMQKLKLGNEMYFIVSRL
ncbi:TPA: RmtC family 16S rRNA (guanine(1405)-N(7))-methyltransferase [Vibrio cholerae O1 biovar El Tor Ogawa]